MKNKFETFNIEYFYHNINGKMNSSFENLSDTISETLLMIELLYINIASHNNTNYDSKDIDLIASDIDDIFLKYHSLIKKEVNIHLDQFFENNRFRNL